MVTRRLRAAPLFVPMVAAMLIALWGGLARIGFPLGAGARVVFAHGPLMVVGVMGTVIAIERAVAVGRTWAFAAPVFSIACALGLVAGLPLAVCAWLSAAGGAVLCAALLVLGNRARDASAVVIGVGAVVYVVGCVRWALGGPVFLVLPYWTAWLVLTIAGERLELTRVLPPSPFARALLLGIVTALCVCLGGPSQARGVVTIAMAAWLLRFDVARRVVSRPGLPRFTALTLMSGYVWLGVSGAVLLRYGDLVAGPAYDAATHALLLGFVFTMVFAHAPTILPAVLGIALPFRRIFYAHVALLHVGLVARVAGDLIGNATLRAWGGMTNAAALLLFAAITARSAKVASR